MLAKAMLDLVILKNRFRLLAQPGMEA